MAGIKTKVIAALITTATVLVTIYVLRKLPVTDKAVDIALNG